MKGQRSFSHNCVLARGSPGGLMPTQTFQAFFDSDPLLRLCPRSRTVRQMVGVADRTTRVPRTANRPNPGRVRRRVEETTRRRVSRCRARSGWPAWVAQTRYVASFRQQGSLVVLASSPQSHSAFSFSALSVQLSAISSDSKLKTHNFIDRRIGVQNSRDEPHHGQLSWPSRQKSLASLLVPPAAGM